jgi:hypothetical protein
MKMTPINNAFDFESSIKPNQITPEKYSPVCIYCSGPNSIALMKDGSFRKCSSCNKHFKSTILPRSDEIKRCLPSFPAFPNVPSSNSFGLTFHLPVIPMSEYSMYAKQQNDERYTGIMDQINKHNLNQKK